MVKAYELIKERLQKEMADLEKLTEYQNEIHFYADPPKRTDLGREDRQIKKHIYIISHPNYKKITLYKVRMAKNLQSRLNNCQTSDSLREYKIELELLTSYFREMEDCIHHNKFKFSHDR